MSPYAKTLAIALDQLCEDRVSEAAITIGNALLEAQKSDAREAGLKELPPCEVAFSGARYSFPAMPLYPVKS